MNTGLARIRGSLKRGDTMAQPMTASNEAMTIGQVETLVDQLRAAARKHGSELPRAAAQQALGTPNLGVRMFAVFREVVEQITKQIVRIVRVDRSRSPHEALKASGRKLYLNDEVVTAMPRGEGDEVKLVYFQPRPEAYDKNGWLSSAVLEAEYAYNGLEADPLAQIADNNVANPDCADARPNACQWKDKDGNYCYAAFDRFDDERNVLVYRYDYGWNDPWVFAGVRKSSSALAV